MPEVTTVDRWARYVADYHDANPGITEEVLAGARDDRGRSPYDWLAEAVPADAGTVVDLACGSMPVARLLPAGRIVGIDRSAGELGQARAAGAPGWAVRGSAAALPIAAASAGAVVASLALMLLHPLDEVLIEVARVLRPGAAFVATMPVRSSAPAAFAGVLAALGQDTTPYPEPLPAPTTPGRFAAAGLTLRTDEPGMFSRSVRGPADAERVVRSFYAPGAGPERIAEAVARLRRQVEVAPVELTYRMRRLVAIR